MNLLQEKCKMRCNMSFTFAEFGDFAPCLMAKGNPADTCQCASNNQSYEFFRPISVSNHQECTVQSAVPTTTTTALTTVAMICPAGMAEDNVLGSGCFESIDFFVDWATIEQNFCTNTEMIKITEYEVSTVHV